MMIRARVRIHERIHRDVLLAMFEFCTVTGILTFKALFPGMVLDSDVSHLLQERTLECVEDIIGEGHGRGLMSRMSSCHAVISGSTVNAVLDGPLRGWSPNDLDIVCPPLSYIQEAGEARIRTMTNVEDAARVIELRRRLDAMIDVLYDAGYFPVTSEYLSADARDDLVGMHRPGLHECYVNGLTSLGNAYGQCDTKRETKHMYIAVDGDLGRRVPSHENSLCTFRRQRYARFKDVDAWHAWVIANSPGQEGYHTLEGHTKTVDVFFPEVSPASFVAGYHSTGVMNLISSRGLRLLHPSLTLRYVSVWFTEYPHRSLWKYYDEETSAQGAGELHKQRRLIEKCESRGMEVVRNQREVSVRSKGYCAFCSAHPRLWNDPDALYIPFPPGEGGGEGENMRACTYDTGYVGIEQLGLPGDRRATLQGMYMYASDLYSYTDTPEKSRMYSSDMAYATAWCANPKCRFFSPGPRLAPTDECMRGYVESRGLGYMSPEKGIYAEFMNAMTHMRVARRNGVLGESMTNRFIRLATDHRGDTIRF
ncbi:hypothetical protein JB92DRAFT_61830 [Gautieria morchelliformis]|nr:hypothetical protein JB92DRAFT_61830 [Gautieria morchelliformis]